MWKFHRRSCKLYFENFQKRGFTEDTSICVLWEGRRVGGARIFFPLCESVQLISLWGQMWLSLKSLYSGRGSLNVITKEDFVTPFNFNTFSPYNKVDNWRWYMRVNLYRCLSRVYCAWNCWGWGLFEWGGLARELRTLMEGPAPRHVGGLWKLDMKPLCAKYFHISLYCTSLDLSSSKIFW